MQQRTANPMIYIGDNIAYQIPRMAQGMWLDIKYNKDTGRWTLAVKGIGDYISNVIEHKHTPHCFIWGIKIIPGTTSVNRPKKGKPSYNSKEKKVSGGSMSRAVFSEQIHEDTDITDLMHHMIFTELNKNWTKYKLVEAQYHNHGYWYKKYRFAVQINNTFYAPTDIFWIRIYHEGPIEEEDAYYEYDEETKTISVYEI